MRSILVTFLVFVSVGAWGQNNTEYLSCELMQIAEAQENTFVTPLYIQVGEGADRFKERTKTSGDYKVIYQVNGTWLSLTWYKGEKLLAMTQSILGGEVSKARATIVYNPLNPFESLSLSCVPQTKSEKQTN